MITRKDYTAACIVPISIFHKGTNHELKTSYDMLFVENTASENGELSFYIHDALRLGVIDVTDDTFITEIKLDKPQKMMIVLRERSLLLIEFTDPIDTLYYVTDFTKMSIIAYKLNENDKYVFLGYNNNTLLRSNPRLLRAVTKYKHEFPVLYNVVKDEILSLIPGIYYSLFSDMFNINDKVRSFLVKVFNLIKFKVQTQILTLSLQANADEILNVLDSPITSVRNITLDINIDNWYTIFDNTRYTTDERPWVTSISSIDDVINLVRSRMAKMRADNIKVLFYDSAGDKYVITRSIDELEQVAATTSSIDLSTIRTAYFLQNEVVCV